MTTEGTVREIAEPLKFVEPARRGAFARPPFTLNTSFPRRMNLLWLEGIESQVTPNLKPLAYGEMAFSATQMFQLQLHIGQTFTVGGLRMTVTQQFDDVPFDPLPEFWCGYPQLFMPTAAGDAPPPSAIVSQETIAAMGAGVAFVYDEYQITHDPITMTDANELVSLVELHGASRLWDDVVGLHPFDLRVERGELVVVRGRSGSGKSTLLALVAGLCERCVTRPPEVLAC